MFVNKIRINATTLVDIMGKVMTGASALLAGDSGSVPTPPAGAHDKFLRGDAQWATPTAAVGITDSEWAQIEEIL